jgi:hypothetical protein
VADETLTWRPLIAGGVVGQEGPLVAAWTTVLNALVGTDVDGTTVIDSGGASGPFAEISAYLDAKPASMIATLHLRCPYDLHNGDYNRSIGIVLRDSGGGRCLTFTIGYEGSTASRMRVTEWNTSQNFNLDLWNDEVPMFLSALGFWLRVEDDGVNMIFSMSADGRTYWEVLSQARAAWLPGGGDQLGIGGWRGPTHPLTGIFDSYEVT